MSDPHDPVTRLLSNLKPPEPPASLRASTLSRATRAWVRPATPDRWRQVLESRPLRLAWATTVVALVAAHLALSTRPEHKLAPTAGPEVAASAAQDRELREVVELPRLREAYVALDAASARQAPVVAPPAGAAAPDKEKST